MRKSSIEVKDSGDACCLLSFFRVVALVLFPLTIYFERCCRESVKSIIQGFLPGLALKIFLVLLPIILMTMSKIEGFTSLSSLDKRSAAKYYLFILVNVFLGSVVTGTAFQQLKMLIDKPSTEYVSNQR